MLVLPGHATPMAALLVAYVGAGLRPIPFLGGRKARGQGVRGGERRGWGRRWAGRRWTGTGADLL